MRNGNPRASGVTVFSISAEVTSLQAYVCNVLDKAYLITPDTRSVLAPRISASFTTVVRF